MVSVQPATTTAAAVAVIARAVRSRHTRHLAGAALVAEDQRRRRGPPRERAIRLGAPLQRALERRAELVLAARDLREPEPLQGGVRGPHVAVRRTRRRSPGSRG